MKNDSSRNTFDSRKHYSSVRMQQGRVQLDADWNEQSDIITHRVRTEASDVVGLCGAPLHDPGFHVVADRSQLSSEEVSLPGNESAPAGFAPSDFLISAGRYYVDGILCENEQLTRYLNQPDLKDLTGASAIKDTGLYVVYLDVWQRHLTALDDPSIREIALGGPDTATRTKTVWQVKYWPAGENATGNCLTNFQDFDNLIAAGNGKLSARTKPEQTSTNLCIVPAGAGYRGLENQLYRVEVHDGGSALNITTEAGTPATLVPNTNNQLNFSAGTWDAGQPVEVFSTKAGSNPMNGALGYITNVDTNKNILTLNINVSDLKIEELRLRAVKATYKWSRDNGVVVTAVEQISGQEITVHDLGPDSVLGFNEDQWVEISDDNRELNGLPGQLAQISKIERASNLITLNVTPISVDRNPKLRRWDGVGAIKFDPPGEQYLDLENGVQVLFSDGTFKTGDYWTIPARTATADAQPGNIEWPQDDNKQPLAQLPFGIKHHYCRLAMLYWDGGFTAPEDCRNLFPPITELTSLFYVSGDGQEAMPNDPLPQLLQVEVFNGRWPVADAQVRFVAQGNGRLAANIPALPASSTNTLIISTDTDGVASCAWQLDPDVTKPSQQVEARLLDANGDPLPSIVRFDCNLSIAGQVFYDPGQCETLTGCNTVQKAVDKLSHLMSLYEVSGNDQEVMPGATLEPLQVLVANECGPVAGQKVLFEVLKPGKGTVDQAQAVTDANGIAQTNWMLDISTPRQQVLASLVDPQPPSTAAPTSVRFVANLSLASQVAYDPGVCATLQGGNTVQKALDKLSHLMSLYEVSGNDQEVMPGATPEPLQVLVANECGPVMGQKVSFKVLTGNGTVAPAQAVTDPTGIASTNWTLDTSTPRQQVQASLVDPQPPSIAAPTSVCFVANLSLASQVAYDPRQCSDLVAAKVTTVQAALDELCTRMQSDPFKITSILTVADNNQPLLNDTLVPVSRLKRGIIVVCNKPIDQYSVKGVLRPKPTCFVTVDLPYPLLAIEREFWGNAPGTFGFQPLVLDCEVLSDGGEILWSPTAEANVWLQGHLLQQLVANNVSDRVLAHFTLKGNFIWSPMVTPEWFYLDGDSFGLRRENSYRTDISLPSGDSRPGGDFEMWFWLIAETAATGLILDAVVQPMDPIKWNIVGSVRDASGAVLANVNVLLEMPNGELTAATTDSSGKFTFPVTEKGLYLITARAPNALAEKSVIVA